VTLVAFEGCMYDDSIASCMFNFSHVMYAVSPRYSSSCVESDSIITVSSGFPGDQGSQLRCFDSSHWRIQDKLSHEPSHCAYLHLCYNSSPQQNTNHSSLLSSVIPVSSTSQSQLPSISGYMSSLAGGSGGTMDCGQCSKRRGLCHFATALLVARNSVDGDVCRGVFLALVLQCGRP
jgi:hypothetical protein